MGLHDESVYKVPLLEKGAQSLGNKTAQKMRDIPRGVEWKKVRYLMRIVISHP